MKGKDYPLVSVVMPVYNAVSTIDRSVQSILDQTFSDFEFIIVNEGATNDGTTEILENYAAKDDRIKIIQTIGEKKGIGPSLNMGIKAARGKYIARMDADDYSYPERFEKQVRFMEDNPDIVVCGGQINISGHSNRVSDYPDKPEHIRAGLLFGCPLAHPTVFMKKEFLDSNNLSYNETNPNKIPEDLELWCQISRMGGRISNLNDVVLDYYNLRDNRLSSITNIETHINAAKVHKRYIGEVLCIDIGEFDYSLFMPLFLRSCLPTANKEFLVYEYKLLSMIENANNVTMSFDRHYLALELIKRWNTVIGQYYIKYIPCDKNRDDNADMFIQFSEYDELSFVNYLLEKINIAEDKIPLHIEKCMNNLVEYAKSIHKVIVFGTGQVLERFNNIEYEDFDIIAYCNNDKDRNTEYNDKPLIAPECIKDYSYDHIMIATNMYYQEIKQQLTDELDVDNDIIVSIEILNFKQRKILW